MIDFSFMAIVWLTITFYYSRLFSAMKEENIVVEDPKKVIGPKKVVVKYLRLKYLIMSIISFCFMVGILFGKLSIAFVSSFILVYLLDKVVNYISKKFYKVDTYKNIQDTLLNKKEVE